RMDASHRYGQYTNKKFQPIWSIAGRYNMEQESWFPEFFDAFAPRISVGIQGHIPSTVGPNLVVRYPSVLIHAQSGEYILNISRLPYPDLRWEKTTTVNYAIDFPLFRGRLSGALEYYHKKTTDAIDLLAVPYEYGVTSAYRNGADIKNYGFEMALTFVPVQTRDFRWDITTTYARNNNKALAVKTKNVYTVEDYLAGNVIADDTPLNSIYSWKFSGIDQQTGYATFEHTGEEADVSLDPKDYLVYSGRKDPKFSGGLIMGFQYKNWSLSSQWAFAWGHVKRLNYLFEGDFLMPQPHQNLSTRLLDAWQKPGRYRHSRFYDRRHP
ncbi:MAG: TonB-dependent receptor, partial [Rikenellaceae bacterium]|nr:TonB-dependent receptor [Rikenellaceae bacterium]